MKNALITFTFLINSILAYSQCFDSSNVYTFNYKGHTYKVVKENKDWTDAASCAVSDGGYLVHIDDLEEQNVVFTEVTNNANILEENTWNEFSTSAVWIGGSDSQVEGNWIWDGDNDNSGTQFWSGGSDGTAIGGAYSNWGTIPAEPDNNVGGQDKLTLTIQTNHPNYGKWNDLTSNNSNTIYYVMEYDLILSVEENILKNKIRVYPNPFSEYIFIENSSQSEISNINVYNSLGQPVFEADGIQFGKNKIELSRLESGLYHLKLLLKNGNHISYKIVR